MTSEKRKGSTVVLTKRDLIAPLILRMQPKETSSLFAEKLNPI
jgi:hypothetical protein